MITLIAIFLAPFSNIFILKTSFMDIKLVQLLWAISFAVYFIEKAYKKDLSANHTRNINNNLVFCLYFAVISISALFSVNLTLSVKELIQYVYLFMIMYVVYQRAKDTEFLNRFIKVTIVANIIFVTICILSYLTKSVVVPSYIILQNGTVFINRSLFSTNVLIDTGEVITRLSGIVGLGSTGIANCILIQSIFVNYKMKTSSSIRKRLYILLLVANMTAMIFTYSRIGILLFFAVHFITLLGKSKFKNIGIVSVVILGTAIFLIAFPNVFERIMETFNTQEQSSKYHFAFWGIALKTGYDNLFTGLGIGNIAFNYGNYSYIFDNLGIYETSNVNVHNFLLQIWAEQGMIGFITNCLLIIAPIFVYIRRKNTLGKFRVNNIYDYIFLAYIATLTYNLTNNNFYIEPFWILAGLVYFSKEKLTKNCLYEEVANEKNIVNCVRLQS